MLRISSGQVEVLRTRTRARFEETMMERCAVLAPARCAELGPAPLRTAVQAAIGRAELHGFTWVGPVRLFVELCLLLGSGFDTDTLASLAVFTGHRNIIHGHDFSSDNRRVASASIDGTVQINEIPASPRPPSATLPPPLVIEHPTSAENVRFWPLAVAAGRARRQPPRAHRRRPLAAQQPARRQPQSSAGSRQSAAGKRADHRPWSGPRSHPRVLDLLDSAGTSASFFCIGRRARRSPALCREIVARGHRIENHGNSHSRVFATFGLRRIRVDIAAAQHTLADITGEAPRFFRPPAGLRNPLLDPVLARPRSAARVVDAPPLRWPRGRSAACLPTPDCIHSIREEASLCITTPYIN